MSACRPLVGPWLASLLLVVGAVTPVLAESWLTPSEQEFFGALGLDAKVGGKSYHRKPNYESLVEIGNRAPEPLKARILTLAKAYPKLSLSPEQIKEFRALLKAAAEKAQGELRGAALGGLLNPDSKPNEQAARSVNALLEDPEGPFRKAWRMQAGYWIEKAESSETLAKQMKLVTDDLEKRVSKTRPETDLTLSLSAESGTMRVTGKVGRTPLTAPVVQVVVHKAKANGGLQALDLSMNVLLQGMGVSNMSLLPGKAGQEAAALTKAQEKTFDLPIIKTFGFPNLNPGSQFTLDVDEDLNDVIFFERIAFTAWTAEGKLAIDSVPGLAELQQLREEVPRDDRFKDTARKGPADPTSKAPKGTSRKNDTQTAEAPLAPSVFPPPGGTPDAGRKPDPRRAKVQEQQAQEFLNQARAALGKKQDDQARVLLNQVITVAPESRAANTAKSLLKKLDK